MPNSGKWLDDSVVPGDNPIVARIMQERGVGRRRAYALAKREQAESIDVTSVTLSQKELVLCTLIKHEPRNSLELLEAMHMEGSTIDGHDVVKMLWACQKMQWVKFRERRGTRDRASIFAIKVTTKGYDYAAKLEPDETYNPVEDPSFPEALVAAQPPDETPFDDDLDEVVETTKPSKMIDGMPILNIKDYPAIQTLSLRHVKAEKLNAAARILEQAGEEDMALTIYSKTEFNELELDVIQLIKDARKKKGD